MEFSDKEHEYRKNGIRYTPVGEFLDRFTPEFPKGLIAEQCAKRDGIPAEDIIAKWDLNAEISCDYGHSLHKAIEYWIRFDEITKIPHLRDAVLKFAEKFDRKAIKPEIIVFNDDYQLAGTIDQLQVLGHKRANVIDTKTNAEIRDKSRGYFLPPLADLRVNKLNKYRLQLSMYKALLELKGWTVEKLQLEHWNGTTFETIPLEPVNVEPLLKTINTHANGR